MGILLFTNLMAIVLALVISLFDSLRGKRPVPLTKLHVLKILAVYWLKIAVLKYGAVNCGWGKYLVTTLQTSSSAFFFFTMTWILTISCVSVSLSL